MTVDTDFLVARMLQDTGAFARYAMGFDHDIDDSAGEAGRRIVNQGTGGVRATGAHREMTDFVDSPARLKLLNAPRESYKTSIAAALETRLCLANPGFQVIHAMQNVSFATSKIRETLKDRWDNPESRLRHYFGDMRGKPWTDDFLQFKNGSFIQVSGVDTSRTGGHFNLQIVDDAQDDKNTRTAEGLGKVRRYWQSLQPMLMSGGTQLVIGTPWHFSDLSAHIKANLFKDYQILVLDAGFEPVQKEDGSWDLEGTARFPHLTKERLLTKLKVMEYSLWCAQFLCKMVTGERQAFRREHFQPIKWADWMSELTCYLCTDTGFATNEKACHSVLGLVGLSSNDNAYLLDLEVGHWDNVPYLDRFFGMLKRWENRVPINGQHLEKVTLNITLRSNLLARAKAEGVRLNLIESPRGVNDLSKEARIRSLAPRFNERRWWVVNTVPKHYRDSSGQHLLWDAEGERSEGGVPVPAGELVDQFLHFPIATKRDIADAIADLDRVLPDGTRVCAYSPSASRRFARTLDRAREPSRRVTFDAPAIGESWYEKTARDLNL